VLRSAVYLREGLDAQSKLQAENLAVQQLMQKTGITADAAKQALDIANQQAMQGTGIAADKAKQDADLASRYDLAKMDVESRAVLQATDRAVKQSMNTYSLSVQQEMSGADNDTKLKLLCSNRSLPTGPPVYTLESLQSSQGVALYNAAKALIPGGTQLLSKRPEMFAPDVWPAYYDKAKGCRVWDLDGREFIDMSIMAVGACILGYADDEVDDAVVAAIRKGVNSSLNCPEEVDLARALIELHPWFGMVRYARSGGEAMGMAVRIARAHTRRDTVLFSGYHGWNDWYLAANLGPNAEGRDGLDGQLMPGLQPNGVPRGLAGTAIPFHFNDIDSLRDKIRGKEGQIAAIVIEPARGEEAPGDYLRKLREIAAEIGAVLVFDEITSGYRMCAGGIHRRYGIYPDIAVFAKSMANGYAMAAVLGAERVMQAAQTTFISSTNWTDRVGPVAALATLRKYQREQADRRLIATGEQTKRIWHAAADQAGLAITVSGLPTLAAFGFQHPQAVAMNTRFTIEMLRRGFLGFRQFKASLAHGPAEMDTYANACHEVFVLLATLPAESLLQTPSHHSGFQRLTKE
jgi:glutamate-1-semialdehyde 2,1-aminomutase